MQELIDPFAYDDESDNELPVAAGDQLSGQLQDPFAYKDERYKYQTYVDETDEEVSVLEDLGSSFGAGANSMLEGFGTLYGLVTGDMDNWARNQGGAGREYWEEGQSKELERLKQERAEAVKNADGELAKAGKAVWHTIKSARLASSFAAEQAPMFVPGGAAGRVAGVGAKVLGASANVASKAATGAAVGTGAAMQTGDVVGGAYDDLMSMPEEMWQQNPEYVQLASEKGSELAKEELSLEYSRDIAPVVAGVSVGAQFVPGGRAIDKALAGSATKKAGVGAVARMGSGATGEALSEAIEEGSGQVLANQAARNVDVERELTEGVGEAAGLGALGGAMFGGPSGLAGSEAQGEDNTTGELDELLKKAWVPGTGERVTSPVGTGEFIGYMPKADGTPNMDVAQIRMDNGVVRDVGMDLIGRTVSEKVTDPAAESIGPDGKDQFTEALVEQSVGTAAMVDEAVGSTDDLVQLTSPQSVMGEVGSLSSNIITEAQQDIDVVATERSEAERIIAALEADQQQLEGDAREDLEFYTKQVAERTGLDERTSSEIVESVRAEEGEGTLRQKLQDDSDPDATPVYVSRITDEIEQRMPAGTDRDPRIVKQMLTRMQTNEVLAPRELQETAVMDFLDSKIEAGENVTAEELVDFIEESAPRVENGPAKAAKEADTQPAPVAEDAVDTKLDLDEEAATDVDLDQANPIELQGQQIFGGENVVQGESRQVEELPDTNNAVEVRGAEIFGDRSPAPETKRTVREELGMKFPARQAFDIDTDADIQTDTQTYPVTQQRDGSILVTGDVAAIRAKLPGNMKGRPNKAKTGLIFSHIQAPRVEAAMKGTKGAHSFGRGGKILARKPMKDGKYIGAPATGNTKGKLAGWRKRFKALAIEGAYGKDWYKDSSKAVMQFVGGNLEEARKFVALLSIYSPQAKVDTNTTFALRAWAQYKAGLPISAKTGDQDAKAQKALDDDPEFWEDFWKGEKTGNFYRNLMKAVDPETAGKQGATIDLWMVRAGEYTAKEAPNEQPTGSVYSFLEDETNRIAKELGWSPEEVQAAIWVAMKSRWENDGVKAATEVESTKSGYMHYETVNGKKERRVTNEVEHKKVWLKHARKHTPDARDKNDAGFHYGTGMLRHLGQVSWEARPSTQAGILPGIKNAIYEQMLAYQLAVKEALFPGGKDELATIIGLLVDQGYLATPGVWEGEVSPSGQIPVVMAPNKAGVTYTNHETWENLSEDEWKAAGKPAGFTKHPGLDPAQHKQLEAYAAVIGLVLRQDGVGYHRMFPGTSLVGANAVEFNIGRDLTPIEAARLEAEVLAEITKNSATTTLFDEAMKIQKKLGRTTSVNSIKTHKRTLERLAARAQSNAADVAIVTTPTGVRIMNFGAVQDNKLFHGLVTKAAGEAFVDADVTLEPLFGYADGGLASNNWKENSNGQDYIRALNDLGRPDLVEYALNTLAPRVAAVNQQFSQEFGWGDPGQPLDVTSQPSSRAASYGEAQEGSVAVTGVHYSRSTRETLDSSAYGTGVRGAERSRLDLPGADPAVRNRVYFYVNEGNGVVAETGVGGKPHHVQLTNLYNDKTDPDGIFAQAREAWPNNVQEAMNEAERMIVDAGYDGIYSPAAFGKQGVAVLLGDHSVPVTAGLPAEANVTPVAESPREALSARLAASKELPGGRMRASAWIKRIEGTEFDSKAARDSLAARGDDLLYRSDLADVFLESTPEAALALDVEPVEELTFDETAELLDGFEVAVPEPKTVTRRNLAEKQAWVSSIVGQLMKRMGKTVEVVNLRQPQSGLVRTLEKMIGREIIVVKGMGKIGGFAQNLDTDTIVINVNSSQPALTVIGHEFLHTIRYKNEALYRKLRDAIIEANGIDIKTEARKMNEARKRSMKANGISGRVEMNLDLAAEEIIADIVGNSFADPAFWQRFAEVTGEKTALTFMEKFSEWVTHSLDFIQKRIPRAMRSGWVRDLQTTNDLVAEAMNELRNTDAAQVVDAPAVALDLDTQEEVDDKPGWDAPQGVTFFEEFVRAVQNKYVNLVTAQRRIRESGREISEEADARLWQVLYPGVLKSKIDDFEAEYLEPVRSYMRKSGYAIKDIGKYLVARHVILDNVNEKLDARNPDAANGALSGMTDEEARQIMADYEGQPGMVKIARLVDMMNEEKLNLLVEEGVLSQEESDRWRGTYQHYVPLMREDVGHSFAGGLGTGAGFQQRGKLSKIRAGSKKQVDFANVVGQTFAQYEAALTRIEKNKVARALYNLAKENPADTFWKVDQFPQVSKINPTTKEVEYTPNTQDPGLIPYKENGESKWIWMQMENPAAEALAKAWKNEDVGMGDLGKKILSPLMGLMRYFAMINTSLSPEFVISNFMRDLQTAGVTMQDTEIKGQTLKVMKSVLPAIKGIMEANFTKTRRPDQSQWAQLYHELKSEGGTMGWVQSYEDVSARSEAITKRVNRGLPLRSAEAVLDTISSVNEAVENGVRLAAYKAARDNGLSKKQAAKISRELTVNFQEKGYMGTVVNTAYLFYNASVQGTVRLGRAALRSNKARIGLGGIMFLSMLSHMVGMLDEDDDEYRKISPEDRERNFIVPFKINGVYPQIPLGWGLNVFAVIGQEMGDATLHMMGEQPHYSIGDSGLRTLFAALNAFNPINDGSFPLLVSPTITDPLTKITTNTDWHGGPLYPDWVKERADYLKYYNSVSEPAKIATRKLAEWTTRADGTPAVDWSPETLDMWWDTMAGSVGRFMTNTIGTGWDLATGENTDREIRKIPIIRKLIKEVGESDRERYFYMIQSDMKVSYRAFKDNEDNDKWMDKVATPKMLDAWDRFNEMEKKRRKIGKTLNAARADKDKELEKEIRAERLELMEDWLVDHFAIMYDEEKE
jgi:hypothetical protein